MKDNKYFFIVVFICLGILECYFGKRLFKPTLFIAGWILAFIFCMYVIITFFYSSSTTSVQSYIYLGVASIVGIIFGCLAIVFAKIGLVFLGALTGFVIGSFGYLLFISWFVAENDQMWLFIVACICAVLCAGIAFKHEE